MGGLVLGGRDYLYNIYLNVCMYIHIHMYISYVNYSFETVGASSISRRNWIVVKNIYIYNVCIIMYIHIMLIIHNYSDGQLLGTF